MNWQSPATGHRLVADTAHSLTDGVSRFPVIDGIPFLRGGRQALVAGALGCLDRGDIEAATVLLLADQDDWWHGATADPQALRHLLRNHRKMRLRDAMELLAWGPVATYFAHRWSDPTFLAGLALMQAHWQAPSF